MQLFSKSAVSDDRHTGVKQNLMWNSHSGSCILGSAKSQRGTLYCYIIMLALSLVSEERASKNAENCHCRQSHCKYPHKSYIARKQSHWATFLLLIVWVCLRSNFRGGLWKRRMFCATECITVVQGHPRSEIDFGTNQNHACNFLLVTNSNLAPT